MLVEQTHLSPFMSSISKYLRHFLKPSAICRPIAGGQHTAATGLHDASTLCYGLQLYIQVLQKVWQHGVVVVHRIQHVMCHPLQACWRDPCCLCRWMQFKQLGHPDLQPAQYWFDPRSITSSLACEASMSLDWRMLCCLC